MNFVKRLFVVGFVLGTGIVARSSFAAAPANAQIPAWLDDGISDWNKANAANQIKFMDIKDSYVWYSMTGSSNLSSKDVRNKVYGVAYKAGYANTQDEEIVTTGRPPVKSGAAPAKKCWTRSFLRDIQKGSDTTVQRMLTSMVCEDGPNWAFAFRVLQ